MIHIHIYIHIYIYIYIYIHIHTYIYIYMPTSNYPTSAFLLIVLQSILLALEAPGPYSICNLRKHIYISFYLSVFELLMMWGFFLYKIKCFSYVNLSHVDLIIKPTEITFVEENSSFLRSLWDFPSGSEVKNPHAKAGDTRDVGSILGLGRYPGGGNGNPL